MTELKMRQSWREKEKKKCKKVLIIDATDYPLVRVVRPFSPVGISGDDLLTDIDGELRMSLWSFYDFDYEQITMEGGISKAAIVSKKANSTYPLNYL